MAEIDIRFFLDSCFEVAKEARRRSVVLAAYQGKTRIQAANKRQKPPLFGLSISDRLQTIVRVTKSPLTLVIGLRHEN